MTIQLDVQAINKTFYRMQDSPLQVLSDISFQVQKGEILGIIGTNGAGKSTLLNCLTGHTPVTSGSILLNGQVISNQAESKNAALISRIFQDPRMGTAPRMTVFENLMLASRRGQKPGFKRSLTKDNYEAMRNLLSQFHLELEDRLNVPIEALSGGQRQAIALIMATLKRPELLLLDEHTAALDPRTSRQVMQMTADLIEKEGLTALMITHQLPDAIQYCDRILLMHKGQIQHIYDQEEVKTLTAPVLYRHLEDLIEAEAQASL